MKSPLYLRAAIGVTAVVLLGTLGCADPQVAAVEQMVAALQEMNATLESIHDPSSAAAAQEKVRDLSARIERLNQRIQNLGEASAETQRELEPLLGQLRHQTLLLVQNMQRVAEHPALRELLPDMGASSAGESGDR
jgi:peptidoglycan hydrolase CwlO-like protein